MKLLARFGIAIALVEAAASGCTLDEVGTGPSAKPDGHLDATHTGSDGGDETVGTPESGSGGDATHDATSHDATSHDVASDDVADSGACAHACEAGDMCVDGSCVQSTVTFTSGEATWTVPATSDYVIEAMGGAGGQGGTAAGLGGHGADAKGTFMLTRGEVLTIPRGGHGQRRLRQQRRGRWRRLLRRLGCEHRRQQRAAPDSSWRAAEAAVPEAAAAAEPATTRRPRPLATRATAVVQAERTATAALPVKPAVGAACSPAGPTARRAPARAAASRSSTAAPARAAGPRRREVSAAAAVGITAAAAAGVLGRRRRKQRWWRGRRVVRVEQRDGGSIAVAATLATGSVTITSL